jgi:hypothetical protein
MWAGYFEHKQSTFTLQWVGLYVLTCQVLLRISLEPPVVHGCYSPDALVQDTARQIATVDHADMRGLVTDLTSLRRGAGLSLIAGIIDRECPLGLSRFLMPV